MNFFSHAVENKKAAEDRNPIIDKMIDLLNKLPDDSFKTKLMTDLQKIKSGCNLPEN